MALSYLEKHHKLDHPHLCFVEDRVFVKNEESNYFTKLFQDEQNQRWEYILLKPKLGGKKLTENKSPIIAVLLKPDFTDLNDKSLVLNDFSLVS